MATILPLSMHPVLTDEGEIAAGAKLYAYLNDTVTQADIWGDADETTPLTNPIEADLDGRWPSALYLDSGTNYTIRITEADDTLIVEADDFTVPSSGSTDIGSSAVGAGASLVAISAALGTDLNVNDFISLVGGRTIENAQAAAKFDNGSIVIMHGKAYEVDSTKIGSDSVTNDLGVDGLIVSGDATPEHYGFNPNDGNTARNTAMQRAVDGQQGSNLRFGDGVYDLTVRPTNLDGVHCTGTPRTNFPDQTMPMFQGVFTGNAEVAIIAFVLRYYTAATALDELGRSSAGWYLIADKAGANHETVLAGPVTASGSSSLVLDVDLDEWGLDDTEWTPAGCNITPDDGLAREGIIFGGSVGTDDIQITGAYANARTGYVAYNGTTWTNNGLNYTVTFSSGVVTCTRDAGKTRSGIVSSNAVSFAHSFTPRAQGSGQDVTCKLNSVDETGFAFRFIDEAAGTRMNSEDTRMEVWITDPAHTNLNFAFGNEPTDNTNIWGIFIARRKPGTY